MNGKRFIRRPQRAKALLLAGFTLLAAAFPLLTGCEADTEATSVLSPEDGGLVALGMTPPTLSEIKSEAGLNESQARLIAPALARWREAPAEPRERGPRGPRMPGEESPVHAFLEDCAQSLDTEAFVAVVEFLAERRDALREEHRKTMRAQNREGRPGRGKGIHGFHQRLAERFHGPRHQEGGGFLSDLDLSDEQKESLHEAFRGTHETLRDLHQAYAAGELTAEQMRDRLRSAQDEIEAALRDVLSEEQFNQAFEKVQERSTRMAGRMLQHMERFTGDRHIAFLTKVLVLDEGQAAAVTQVLANARPEVEALLASVESGDLKFADAVYEGLLIHDGVKDEITGLLDPEQAERMEALRKLHRGPGGGGLHR